MPSRPAPVFLSFVHHDARYARELQDHLAMLARIGVAEPLGPADPSRGDAESGLRSRLDAAWVIVLLLSARYLASAEHMDVHCALAVERHELGLARVIPVRLRACDLQDSPLAHLASIPRGDKPVLARRSRDTAWIEVLTEIRGAIADVRQTRLYTPPAPDAAHVTPLRMRAEVTPLPMTADRAPLPRRADITPFPMASDGASRLHPPTRIFARAPITDLVKQRVAELQPTNPVAFDRFRDGARLSIEAARDPAEEGARVKRKAACRELFDCIENTLYVRFDRVRAAAKSAPGWTEGLASDEAGASLLEHLFGDRYPSLERLDGWLAGPKRLSSGAASALRRSLGISRGLDGEIAKAAHLRGELASGRPISAGDVEHLEWVAGSLLARRLRGRPADTGLPRVRDPR